MNIRSVLCERSTLYSLWVGVFFYKSLWSPNSRLSEKDKLHRDCSISVQLNSVPSIACDGSGTQVKRKMIILKTFNASVSHVGLQGARDRQALGHDRRSGRRDGEPVTAGTPFLHGTSCEPWVLGSTWGRGPKGGGPKYGQNLEKWSAKVWEGPKFRVFPPSLATNFVLCSLWGSSRRIVVAFPKMWVWASLGSFCNREHPVFRSRRTSPVRRPARAGSDSWIVSRRPELALAAVSRWLWLWRRDLRVKWRWLHICLVRRSWLREFGCHLPSHFIQWSSPSRIWCGQTSAFSPCWRLAWLVSQLSRTCLWSTLCHKNRVHPRALMLVGSHQPHCVFTFFNRCNQPRCEPLAGFFFFFINVAEGVSLLHAAPALNLRVSLSLRPPERLTVSEAMSWLCFFAAWWVPDFDGARDVRETRFVRSVSYGASGSMTLVTCVKTGL